MPFYHSVSDRPLPHVRHLHYVKTIKDFTDDMDTLLKSFDPVSLEDLRELAAGNISIKKPSFFLSFDDGLVEFDNIVAPVLLQKGIPATVFVNSAFVDNKGLSFRYKISLIIETLNSEGQDEVNLKEISELLRVEKNEEVSDTLKKLYNPENGLIDKIALLAGVDFNNFLKKNQPYLSKAQIKNLVQKGFDVGAHSIDHPLFSTLGEEEQYRQVKVSVDFIRENFAPKVISFAFPFDDSGVSSRMIREIHNNKVCELSFGTSGLKKQEMPHHFQRTAMERRNLPADRILGTEYLYFILKYFIRKNSIRRTN